MVLRNVGVLSVLAATSCQVASKGMSFNTSTSSSSGSSGSSGSSQASFTVPDMFRMTEADARAALKRAGYQGNASADSSLCGSVVDGHIIEVGQVCYQHPIAGTSMPVRLPMTLRIQTEDPRHGRVGQHGEWHLMPQTVGVHIDKARKLVRAAGFTDARTHVDFRDEPGCKPNIVCRQYPEGLTRGGQNSDRWLIAGADPTAKPKPDPAKPDPAKPDPAKPDPAKPDPTEPEPFF